MMMDPAVKTAMALCIVLGGVCAALWFRDIRPRPKHPPAVAAASAPAEKLSIRRNEARPPSAAAGRRRARPQQPPAAARATQSPLDVESGLPPMIAASPRQAPPPPLDDPPPAIAPPADSRWDHSLEKLLPARAAPQAEQPRRHKIVDGDTLAALAERYLGSAARAGELYQANRDVLLDPQLLPIGVELRIPDR